LKFVALALELSNSAHPGLKLFQRSLGRLQLLGESRDVGALLLELFLCHDEVTGSLLLDLLLLSCQRLDVGLKLPNAHVLFAQRRHLLLVLQLVVAEALAQRLHLLLTQVKSLLLDRELTGLRRKFTLSFVLFKNLIAQTVNFLLGDLRATLRQPQLVFKLPNFLRKLSRGLRLLLVLLHS